MAYNQEKERLNKLEKLASQAIYLRNSFVERFGFKPSWSQSWDERYAMAEFRLARKLLDIEDYLYGKPEDEDLAFLSACESAFLTAFFS